MNRRATTAAVDDAEEEGRHRAQVGMDDIGLFQEGECSEQLHMRALTARADRVATEAYH
jgi:hypothetical protein